MNYKIEFDSIPWKPISIGAQQKEFKAIDKHIRLLRLEDDFEEANWCENGHIGFILEGTMTLKFSGKHVSYKKGEAFYIQTNQADKHKAIIEKGKFVELLIVDEIQEALPK